MPDRIPRSLTIAALVATGFASAPVIAADVDRRLIDAVRAQDATQVRDLLSRRVDVNVRADDGSTPLLWAAHWNDVGVAASLVRIYTTIKVSLPPYIRMYRSRLMFLTWIAL